MNLQWSEQTVTLTFVTRSKRNSQTILSSRAMSPRCVMILTRVWWTDCARPPWHANARPIFEPSRSRPESKPLRRLTNSPHSGSNREVTHRGDCRGLSPEAHHQADTPCELMGSKHEETTMGCRRRHRMGNQALCWPQVCGFDPTNHLRSTSESMSLHTSCVSRQRPKQINQMNIYIYNIQYIHIQHINKLDNHITNNDSHAWIF